MSSSGRPRSASSSSDAAPKNWPRTSRARSASSRRPWPVESTMSAKRTVTTFRSSVPTRGPTAVPQFGQNRAPFGSGRPHTEQVMTTRAGYGLGAALFQLLDGFGDALLPYIDCLDIEGPDQGRLFAEGQTFEKAHGLGVAAERSGEVRRKLYLSRLGVQLEVD